MQAQLFNTTKEIWETVELTRDGQKLFLNGEFVHGWVSNYIPIAGPKAVFMSWDEECGTYTPWNTWYPAKDVEGAWKDALSWAMAEDVPAIRDAV